MNIEEIKKLYNSIGIYALRENEIVKLINAIIYERDTLKQQSAELSAKIDRMQTFIKLSARKWEGVPEVEPTFWNLLRVANESPPQCLLEVKADAGRGGFIACLDYIGERDLEAGELFEQDIHAADQYAKKISRGE